MAKHTGITKLKNGKFRAFADCGYDLTGKRIRPSKVFEKEKDAVLWRAETMLNSEKLDMTHADITFKILATKWIQSKIQRKITAGTLRKYENVVRIVKEYPYPFYEKKARDIKKTDVESLLNYLAFDKGLSLNYIAGDIKQALSSIFAFGVDNDMIFKNPCRKAELPNIKKEKSKKDSFTPEEIETIEKHYKEIPFGDIVYDLLNTGLRSQEICAIDGDSFFVDEECQRYIRVNKAMKRTRTGGWEIGETKTDKSVRNMPISGEIYFSMMKRIMANKDHFLLPGKNPGKRISYDNFNKHYQRFFEILSTMSKEKVRYLPPHCCRHTFNSRLIWKDTNPFIIQSLMGHTNIAMTDNYAHIMNKNLVDAMKKIKAM